MKRLYFDMDNVLVDFESGIAKLDSDSIAAYEERLNELPGVFSFMEPIHGSIEVGHKLAGKYDVYILATVPWSNHSAWTDKVPRATKSFDDIFHRRLILTHRKVFLKGNYLIDVRPEHGSNFFAGEWGHLGNSVFSDWESVFLSVI